ncbi:Cyclic nucleotide-binding-like protein [Corchorus olitorius]|uniref:Cyclic nucleotide-binding-like protein n=1 Tax=Corchorus olitorius TaxID=93759 RepID=A0A1R3KNG6_9ROSI|nr:Cyclic nucleotide-binding-like protein [Corchorus olitorius]
MRVKRQDAEQWMSHRMLPEKLRERIRRYEQYRWQETRGVEEESLISSLPKDLRRDIKRHICLDLLKRSSSSPSLGATLYASKFAANALRTLRHSQSTRLPQRLPPLLPQKPAEPDFTAEDS